jgi:hypothetical protein
MCGAAGQFLRLARAACDETLIENEGSQELRKFAQQFNLSREIINLPQLQVAWDDLLVLKKIHKVGDKLSCAGKACQWSHRSKAFLQVLLDMLYKGGNLLTLGTTSYSL